MANTKSAKKNARQNKIRRLRNTARRSSIKTALKKIHSSLEAKADASKTQELIKDVAAQLARAKSKGIIHPNAASRKLSRIAKRAAKNQRASSQPAPAQ
jgi:small subunit ribosomal protein S20